MAQYLFVAFTNPLAGRDEDYNKWYDNQHLGDVTRIPGYVSARRFEFVPVAGTTQPAHRYLALYSVETNDLAATHEALMRAVGSPALPLSDALDVDGAAYGYFRLLSQAEKG